MMIHIAPAAEASASSVLQTIINSPIAQYPFLVVAKIVNGQLMNHLDAAQANLASVRHALISVQLRLR